MKSWTDSLASCAWLVDVAREQGSAMPMTAATLRLWEAERELVAAGRRLLKMVEAA